MKFKVKKKGKTVGRPSKQEINASKLLSYIAEKPEVKKEIREKLLHKIMFGGL